LQSFCPVKLQYSFPCLKNIEETSKDLPNFSIGIAFLCPDSTSSKNKAEKSLHFANLNQSIKMRHYLTDQLAHLFTFLCIMRILRPISIKKASSHRSLMLLCYKRFFVHAFSCAYIIIIIII